LEKECRIDVSVHVDVQIVLVRLQSYVSFVRMDYVSPDRSFTRLKNNVMLI